MTDLAIYDMDKTVTRRPTYTPFLLHCAVRRAPWRLALLPLVAASLLGYALKLVDRARLKEINHRLLIGPGVSERALQPIVRSFAEKTLATNLRPGAVKAIARDKAEGRMVVMATASYRFYAAAIGELLGFDHVIGTGTVAGIDDIIHPRIDGYNCYGAAKLTMIEQWLQGAGLARAHVRFYSDHNSDAFAFEWSDEAVAVNPDAELRRIAEVRGYTVEDWG
ncbi:HAD family hydrolase [Sphingomicrobium astaxanthinifaciens]|uniref:HAD family hydrolase n=1 Tax=Sphingomicrobium astaxanthinifaciens TaxID=1227949 RepID=UPI001FCB6452|nr:HAD-IB family phosphatase [Sphingomicrobium astaxanthinifaciens]MCJ7421453.1 HAD-IB family phosphatase [Sphingomicrobium astaxanthinifaciens]